MSTIVRSIDRGIRVVAGVEVRVTEQVWTDGGASFEVHRLDTGDDLTEDGCFDQLPTDEQIETCYDSPPHCGPARCAASASMTPTPICPVRQVLSTNIGRGASGDHARRAVLRRHR